MKKFGKIFMIAAAAAMVFVSCKKTENSNQPALTITATPTELAVGANGNIELALSAAADQDVVVNLTASSDAIKLAAASATIVKGETKATVTFSAEKAGEVKVSGTSSQAKVGGPATITVTAAVDGWKEYCEIGYAETGSWGSIGWVKMGDKTIQGDEEGNSYYVGENVPLNPSLVVLFQPWGLSDPTGANDPFTIIVYADWKNSGTLAQIAQQDFSAGTEVSEKTFTLDIPADAANKGTIRVISSYTDGNWAMTSDGCGDIESGAAFDIQYVK